MNPMLDLGQLSRRLAELPPLPAMLHEVLVALDSGALSTQRCINLIEHDPALAARLVRLANSAFYGRAGAIGSISGAVTLLGLRTVSGVLTAATLHSSLQVTDCPAFSLERYWRRAIASALVSSTLAGPNGLDPSEAFLAGLMHDIGQLMLAVLAPAELEALLCEQPGAELQPARELTQLGVSHTQLGAQIAQRWHFPASIVQAIDGHHRPLAAPPSSPADLAALIQLCDEIVMTFDQTSEPPSHTLVSDGVWEALRVPEGDRATFYERIAEGVSDFCRHL